MRLKFSDRIGVTNPPTIFQLDNISIPLKNSIWNYLRENILSLDHGLQDKTDKNIDTICKYFLKLPIDSIRSYNAYKKLDWLREYYFDKFDWYEVYNFIEFISDTLLSRKSTIDKNKYYEIINFILQEEMSGFRFINGVLAPITNSSEIDSIISTMELAKENQLYGTTKHIETAITLLSQKPKPDYRNSIKESISGIESIVKQITGEEGGGLDKALSKLESEVKFHGAFKAGLLSLYGYSSDENGIRHAILEEPNVNFDEAKFILVSCSALINFIISKATNSGLL